MEFAVQAWCPHIEKEKIEIERIQRRATKIPSSIRHLSYEERLKVFGLTTLEAKSQRGDLIEMYKIVHDFG